MNRMLFRLFATALLMGVVAVDSFATQVIQKSPKELAQASPLVVDGKVQSVRSYWNDDHSKIFTEALVAVASTHKGAAAPSVRVVQPGGVVGNVRMTAHGALQWKKGEEVLLFLEPATPGAFQVAGFSQGKFLIERDPQSGTPFVKQAIPPDTDSKTPANGANTTARTTEKLTLEQFLDRVLPNE
jgi:LysM repeat protein